MMRPESGDAWIPRAEDLAAYVDGELESDLRRQVEGWLVRHPEAASELEDHHRLARLWQTAGPPEPTSAQWATVLAGVAKGLPVPRRTDFQSVPRQRWRRLLGVA